MKGLLLHGFFAYSHNLVKVCMECDYTCLNYNLLMSQKKMVTKDMIIKGVYCIWTSSIIIITFDILFKYLFRFFPRWDQWSFNGSSFGFANSTCDMNQ
jgi:hypothetical protein